MVKAARQVQVLHLKCYLKEGSTHFTDHIQFIFHWEHYSECEKNCV